MAKEIVSMSMKKDSRQDFCEVVREINGCVDSVQEYQVAFESVT